VVKGVRYRGSTREMTDPGTCTLHLAAIT